MGYMTIHNGEPDNSLDFDPNADYLKEVQGERESAAVEASGEIPAVDLAFETATIASVAEATDPTPDHVAEAQIAELNAKLGVTVTGEENIAEAADADALVSTGLLEVADGLENTVKTVTEDIVEPSHSADTENPVTVTEAAVVGAVAVAGVEKAIEAIEKEPIDVIALNNRNKAETMKVQNAAQLLDELRGLNKPETSGIDIYRKRSEVLYALKGVDTPEANELRRTVRDMEMPHISRLAMVEPADKEMSIGESLSGCESDEAYTLRNELLEEGDIAGVLGSLARCNSEKASELRRMIMEKNADLINDNDFQRAVIRGLFGCTNKEAIKTLDEMYKRTKEAGFPLYREILYVASSLDTPESIAIIRKMSNDGVRGDDLYTAPFRLSAAR